MQNLPRQALNLQPPVGLVENLVRNQAHGLIVGFDRLSACKSACPDSMDVCAMALVADGLDSNSGEANKAIETQDANNKGVDIQNSVDCRS